MTDNFHKKNNFSTTFFIDNPPNNLLDSKSDMKQCSDLELQLKGYRLATAEFIYRMPDYLSIMQSFIFQTYDLKPNYPEIHKFIAFWEENIDGPLVSVAIESCEILKANDARFAKAIYRLQ